MADEKYTFEQARIRLEEIAAEVRKKDTSLEKSLDLLEEGVRLANICTELVDHPDVSASVPVPEVDVITGSDGGTAETDEPVDFSDHHEADDAAIDDLDEAFDTDGFDDMEEPSAAPAEEDTQD